MTPAEVLAAREALQLSRAEFAALLGVTERTILARETGGKPVNLQAALAIEFVLASRGSTRLRAILAARIKTVANHRGRTPN